MASVGVIACALVSSPAAAQVTVDVLLAPAVQARASDLGRGELAAEQAYLQQDVQRALAHDARVAHVRLVVQDIQPTRPTSRELGLSSSLSFMSVGLGGAAVTGEVTAADGTVQPVRYRFFQTTLHNELDFSTWGDANYAFDHLARDIALGAPPNQQGAWPPPHVSQPPTGTRLGG